MDSPLTRRHLNRWRTAIFTIFFATGLGFASWASRLPAVKADLNIGDTEIGTLLFVMGAASVVGLPLANLVVARWGARRGMYATIVVFATGMVVVGIGVGVLHAYPLAATGLAMMGLGMSTTDILMNVEAATVEQQYGRTLMPLFHAFFSFGTVAGAGIGVAMTHLGVSVPWHVGTAGVTVLIVGFVALLFVPVRETVHDGPADARTRRERMLELLSVWRDPRTYAIGLIMLGMAFAEGAAGDWLPIAMVDGHGQAESTGAVALTVFSVAMTVVRVAGGPLVDRVGRVWALRVLSVTAGIGLVLFIAAWSVPVAFIGIALWGAGAALGFPLGMSAAADDLTRAAASVSAAASIGYLAFLCGPPALGWVSDHIGILPTLWIVVGLIALSGLASGAAAPRRASRLPTPHP